MDAQSLISNAQMASERPVRLSMSKNEAQIRKTAKQFEAQFMTQMLEHMFTGIDPEKGLFGGGHAESMFRPMLLDEYGKMIANRGNGVGIGQKVASVLLAQQEVQH